MLRVLKNRAAGSIAPTGSFADRRSVCVGADDFHRPGNAAIAGSFAEQSGHWIGKAGQPEVTAAGVNARPTILHKWVPGKETAAAKAKFPVLPAVCLVL